MKECIQNLGGTMNNKPFALSVLCGAVMILLFCSQAGAEQKGTFFELGGGVGRDMHGLGTTQALLAPALSLPIINDIFRLRLEGNFEIIFDGGKTMIVGGISPMIRASITTGSLRPFLELGPGINLADKKEFDGRHLGGAFFFSAMGGLGLEVPYSNRILSLSIRTRHLSNGHVRKGWNQGLNSQYLMISTSF